MRWEEAEVKNIHVAAYVYRQSSVMNDIQRTFFLRGLDEAATSASEIATAERLSFEADAPPQINPYTTTGFIVWYCFIFLCCGLPMICCCISMCYVRVRRKLTPSSSPGTGNETPSPAVLASAEDDAIALEIARIEANVRAFCLKEQQLRKSNLTKAWIEHKMIVGKETIVQKETKEKCCSGSSDSDCDSDDWVESKEDSFELHHIPLPGFKIGETSRRRTASSHCAICLESYRVDDVIVWSANVNCSHVFHEKCMQNWIMKRFKPDCPMCRQTFVNMSMNKDTSSSAGETEPSIADLDEHDVVERGEECLDDENNEGDTGEDSAIKEGFGLIESSRA